MKESATTSELLPFLESASKYLRVFPKERSTLTWALQIKFLDKYKKFIEDYNKEVNDHREELKSKHCLKEKGVFVEKEVKLENQVVFQKQFSEEGEKKFRSEMDQYLEKKGNELVPDFKPYRAELRPDLHISWYKEFVGFVFEPMNEEQEFAFYMAQKEQEKDKE